MTSPATRTPATFLLVWLTTGAGAVAGSILGAAIGKAGLFAGAVVGGVLAAALSVSLAVRLGWIGRREHQSARWGAVLGVLVAAPIAALNLGGPVIPVLATALTGVGALIGASVAAGR